MTTGELVEPLLVRDVLEAQNWQVLRVPAVFLNGRILDPHRLEDYAARIVDVLEQRRLGTD